MACGRRCSTVLAGGQLLGAQLGGPLLHAWVRSVASSAPASRIEPGGVMLVGTPRNNAMLTPRTPALRSGGSGLASRARRTASEPKLCRDL